MACRLLLFVVNPPVAQQAEVIVTNLAFGALVIAAAAWTVGNTGIAPRVSALARRVFIVFLTLAAILFALAVLGINGSPDGDPPLLRGVCVRRTP